jgi:hypothetical protein
MTAALECYLSFHCTTGQYPPAAMAGAAQNPNNAAPSVDANQGVVVDQNGNPEWAHAGNRCCGPDS